MTACKERMRAKTATCTARKTSTNPTRGAMSLEIPRLPAAIAPTGFINWNESANATISPAKLSTCLIKPARNPTTRPPASAMRMRKSSMFMDGFGFIV